MRMRKVLVGLTATAIVLGIVILGAVGVDFGASIYAEYRLSTSVRKAAHLGSDPFVAILGFPFIPQAMRHRYFELEIKAIAVEHAVVGVATLEATMHSIDLSQASWLIEPNSRMTVHKLESRIIIDSMHLGRHLGISDLMVQAPPQESNDATGGTTESGISDGHGLVLSGTPTSADFDHRVSVSVDVSIAPEDQSTLVITPTRVVTGPDTADQTVPDDKLGAVLRAFSSRLPNQKLPFAVAPNTVGARGSDIIIEGITNDVTISLEGFRQS